MKNGVILLLVAALLGGCGNNAEMEALRKAEIDARKRSPQAAAGTPAPRAEAEAPKEDKPKEEVKKEDARPAGDSATLEFGAGNTIVVPSAWKKEAPANNMRLLQIRVPKIADDKEDGELTVFKFSGGVEANVKRWAEQFGGKDSLKAQKTVKTASGHEATVAEFEGTYTAMTMAGSQAPKQNYKMVAAIIITDKGEFQVKLPGPKATIDAAKADFDKLVQSFK